jgi:hypothetical protein
MSKKWKDVLFERAAWSESIDKSAPTGVDATVHEPAFPGDEDAR